MALPSGQLSNTVWAISPAESDGLNKNSFVFPLTKISRRFICKLNKIDIITFSLSIGFLMF